MPDRFEHILGLNMYFHDSAGALLRDGELLAAIEEERWFRDDKHTDVFPVRSIRFCLAMAGQGATIDHVAIDMEPLRCLRDAHGLWDCLCAPSRLTQKLRFNYFDRRRAIARAWAEVTRTLMRYGANRHFRWHRVAHHDAHAASAFFVSPFDEAAVLTMDANGEWATTTGGIGRGARLTRQWTIGLPDSLGGVYGTVTEHLGFRRNEDEFKVMGLASYGDPAAFRDVFDEALQCDGSVFRVARRFFEQAEYKLSASAELIRRLGPRRMPDEALTDRHRDIAAALQERLEQIVLHLALQLRAETGQKNLCLAGGVALNCVANARLLEEAGFEELYVQPAAYDAGCALGAALWVRHQILGRPRQFVMTRADYGPEYRDAEIEKILRQGMLSFSRPQDVCADAARLIADGKIVGWFQGRAEFGPRALGHRSILADPTQPEMRDHINARVKHREEFRPFAPAATVEDYQTYFDAHQPDPFMTTICRVREEWKPRLPAITHVDGTARLQTVRADVNPRFHRLLREFAALRGVAAVLNTSFNVAGEPMVLNPQDALRCFFTTGIDHLVIGSYIVNKAV